MLVLSMRNAGGGLAELRVHGVLVLGELAFSFFSIGMVGGDDLFSQPFFLLSEAGKLYSEETSYQQHKKGR